MLDRPSEAAPNSASPMPPPAMPIPSAAPAAAGVALTPGQRLVCERIINVFETGSIVGDYANISIFNDGPHGIRQITYGRAQTTEYGNLRKLVQMYVEAGGLFAQQLRDFVPRIGLQALVDDQTFKSLLRRAGGEDPIMRSTQDAFFDAVYFQPALRWANANGFTLALSMLVIYDSFIHSGSILPFLRARFAEVPPASGGREKVWIQQYVEVRHNWLANHPNHILRNTIYRTRDMMREIERGNWDLALLPIMAHGVAVDDKVAGMLSTVASLTADEIPFLGDPDAAHIHGDEAPEIFGDDHFAAVGAVPPVTPAAAGSDVATLAQRILANPKITLATVHASGVDDQATVRQNIVDTAAGGRARRSSYGTAPGGTVALDPRLLRSLLTLADEYSFSISELVGGSHNANSRHYAGIAADISVINGQHVSAGHPDFRKFMQRARDLGATEVLGPGNAGHSTHVHAAWPRP
jgi:glycosyl hydrolase family 46